MEKIGYKPNAVTYGRIMNSLCKIGKTNDAIGLFRKMEERNLELDVVMYSIREPLRSGPPTKVVFYSTQST
jgi:pentatricopeptide repeat protein